LSGNHQGRPSREREQLEPRDVEGERRHGHETIGH
jgi:hypothetical protein